MKNQLLFAVTLGIAFLATNDARAQELFRADFETFESTPYYFRFGNKGAKGEYNYKPRWMYSHRVVANPLKDTANPSGHVLEYTTMEARDYGLKFRFENPLSLDALQTISFRIYQPSHVIGKEVESAYSHSPATKQNIAVKILSYFNSINDFKQDEGILMTKSAQSFTRENEWVEYTFAFSKSDYASQLGKFTKGIVGIAILPTYESGVTLGEANRYVCYLDDIAVNPSGSGVGESVKAPFQVSYAGGNLYLCLEETGEGVLTICDMAGKTLCETTLCLSATINSVPLSVPKGVYIVTFTINNRVYRTKVTI